MKKSDNRMPGRYTDTQHLFAVAVWLGRQRETPTPKRICDTFGVHKATAYRYLAAWRLVNGASK